MSELIGKQLGPYRIVEQIGAGGMATVYKAYQASLDRYVAVKVLPPYYANEPGFSMRFTREAKAVAKLDHPHVLPIYDFGREGDLGYIAMKHVAAGTLKEMLGQPLPPAQAAEILSQIAAALDYAHQQGVIHRDVKPSNVLMERRQWALLTDFGLAKMVEGSVQLTGTGVGLGTPAYMSPEQGQGEKVDSRSDVYSLGVVLYEMVTGRVPYEAETPMAVVLKHITAPLPLPSVAKPDIPEVVERVILKALAKNPNDRFKTAGELAAAFGAAIRLAPAEAQARVAPDRPGTEQAAATLAEGGLVRPAARLREAAKTGWLRTAMWTTVGAVALLALYLVLSRVPLKVQISGGRLEVVRVVDETATPETLPSATPMAAATPTKVTAVQPTATPLSIAMPTETPIPTTRPTVLPTLAPVRPEGGKEVHWCENVTPPQLCVHDMSTGQSIQVTENLGFEARGVPSWSPDGQQILFPAGSDRPDHNLYLINADGSDLKQITGGDTHDQEAEWSPDGEWIALYRDCNLWRVRPDGSDIQPLLVSEEFCTEVPTWSPDSQRMAFLYFRDGLAREIWVINADGSDPHAVYSFDKKQPERGGVVWNPDGRQILCWYWEPGSDQEQRVFVNTDGSGEAATIGGVPYWWGAGYWPRWGRVDYSAAREVSIDLGTINQMHGLAQLFDMGDGVTAPADIGGKDACVTKPNQTPGRYIYFDVDDDFLFARETPVRVTVEYYDLGNFSFSLDYDSTDRGAVGQGVFKHMPQDVWLTDSGEWKTATFDLPDAYFGGRQHSVADFRIACDDNQLYVNTVTVKKLSQGSLAEQARAFAEPILAAIAGRAPDYEDDFSDPGSGWGIGPTDGGESGYQDDEYFIVANPPSPEAEYECASVGAASGVSDFVLELDGRFTAGETGDWQVKFREEDDRYYAVLLASDGYLDVWKSAPEEERLFTLRGSPVKSDHETNHLQVVARGPKMAFYLNGEALYLLYDEVLITGAVDLTLCNHGGTPVRAHFDNFKLWNISDLELPSTEAGECRIAYVLDGDIYVRDCDGSNVRRLTDHAAMDHSPAWSPDGTRIVFTSDRDATHPEGYQLYLMNADGSNPTRLTTRADRNAKSASWSPDGSRIAFHSYCDLMVIDADGSNWTTLVERREDLCPDFPTWAHDGHRIAFRNMTLPDSGPPVKHDIYVVNDDGSGLLKLAALTSEDWSQHVVWSPDGSRVAFDILLDGQERYYAVNSDGSGEPAEIPSIPVSWYPWYWPQWGEE